eukprot:CAMPEP_0198143778 /NCGR_PEP_ID=MMETSP1443-20131203/10400_1 /TAXON_ID=186043 /ORGANISM="Entomoneis sp., Strain CCMP2396" /LENGTH=391 /DNA_ID=CAMNT_0043807063 /DNA_START=201 /DNA_END=1376 /DNA_ORIENTATION=+
MTAVLLSMAVTNPANGIYIERFRKAVTGRGSTKSRREQQPQQPGWTEMLHRMHTAYTIFTSDIDGAEKQPSIVVDDSKINFALFAVRETKSKRLQVMGFNSVWQCRIQHSRTCGVLRDFLLPRRLSRVNNQQEQMEQLLFMEPLSHRRYFIAYQYLMGIAFLTFILTLAGGSRLTSLSNEVTQALLRGFWPNPYQPLSSVFIGLCDLSFLVAPALQVMEELIPHQSKKSWFRPTSNVDWNYAFAVAVFMIGASCVNLTRVHWNTIVRSWNQVSLPEPSVGYSSDVWAACALGFLRATKDSDFALTVFGDYQVSVVTATWVRFVLQFTVLSKRFSLASVGLWLAADMVGLWIGSYQVQNHFATAMLDNFVDGVNHVWNTLVGGGGGDSRSTW